MALEVGTNSYISVADATIYFEDRLYSDAWTSATDTTRAQALIMATKRIDRVPVIGRKADSAQALSFPRAYAREATPIQNNVDYSYDLVPNYAAELATPRPILEAVCEEALALLDRGSSARTKLQQQGVTSASVVGISESYALGSGRGLLSQDARDLMTPYRAGAVPIC